MLYIFLFCTENVLKRDLKTEVRIELRILCTVTLLLLVLQISEYYD